MKPDTGKSSCFVREVNATAFKSDKSKAGVSGTSWEAIFENASTALAVVEEDTTITAANMEFVEMTGYSKEELVDRMSWTILPVPEDLERLKISHHAPSNGLESGPRKFECRIAREG